MLVRFICGCTSKEIITRDNLLTMDRIGYDEEGFVICLDHNSRRYGWRSVPARANSWSELEYEAYLLFSELPKIKPLELEQSSLYLKPDNS